MIKNSHRIGSSYVRFLLFLKVIHSDDNFSHFEHTFVTMVFGCRIPLFSSRRRRQATLGENEGHLRETPETFCKHDVRHAGKYFGTLPHRPSTPEVSLFIPFPNLFCDLVCKSYVYRSVSDVFL